MKVKARFEKFSLISVIPYADPKYFIIWKSNQQHHARLFTELQEFTTGNQGKPGHWKETARWVKFEEDKEAGAERWSKPHVGTVSMHAVNEIENQIKVDKERIILDFEASDTDGVFAKVRVLIFTAFFIDKPWTFLHQNPP